MDAMCISEKVDLKCLPGFNEDLRSGLFTSTQLAEKYNITIKKICDYAYHRQIKLPRKVNINESFFETQHPDMAYVLGWLAADGCVSDKGCISMQLQLTDTVMMQNLCKIFGYTGTISESSYFDDRTNKTYEGVNFSFVSHKVTKILETFGIVPRKSLTLGYPQIWKDDEMRRHFIRGYMDGDGWVQRMGNTDSSVSFVGTLHFVRDMQADINRMMRWKVVGTIHDRGNCATLKYGGNQSSLRLLNWIYKDTNPENRLGRKYDLYLDLLQMYKKRNKAVQRSDRNGKNEVVYESVDEAAEQNQLKKATLCCCLNGQNEFCKGYRFRYVDYAVKRRKFNR